MGMIVSIIDLYGDGVSRRIAAIIFFEFVGGKNEAMRKDGLERCGGD